MKKTDEQEQLRRTLSDLSESEARVVERLGERTHISRDTNRQFEEKLTFGQRLADRVAAFVGSWAFIVSFVVILILWTMLNTLILARAGSAFDPYPYILLNLMLSMIAALQAPLIMMSQNRQAAKDRLEAAHDYEVNLKAELEILALHKKMDALLEQQTRLIATQKEQLEALTRSTSRARGATDAES